ncbi:MAG TPA: ABC transporter substrate-binding protein [Bacteriovoracaceae bacterium]|nr:ABC transporter substrate-binding protein [Bacteriovoracaceae bacterium]
MKYLILVLTLSFFGCAKKVSKNNDVFNISLPNDISTLDPANCYDTVCYVPVAQVYETLFELDYLKRPYSLRPLIAEGFPSVSSNKLKYVFKLKKGIKYHKSTHLPEGREVKAQDIVNQIKRLAFQGTRSQGWWLFDKKVKGLNEWRDKVQSDLTKFFSTPVEGVSAPDDQTLVIELIRPYPQLIYAMAMTFTAPVPEEAIRALNNDLTQTSIGTGAYYITNYNSTQEVVLKKNDHYVTSVYPSQGDRFAHEKGLLKDAGAKLPFVPNIKMTVIKEAQTDWLNFMSKKIDMVSLTKDHYSIALTQDGKIKPEITKQKIELQASPTLIYWWIAFNMKDPVVGKNLNLRQAIAHGVNMDKYIELFTYKVAQKANSIYPPGISGYSPSTDLPYKYDLNLAKEYMKKAGYPDGKGLPKLVFDIRGTDTRRRQMGEFIQQELRALGITVEVNVNSFPKFLEKSRKGELQFWQGGWVLDYPDAENVLQLLNSANLPPGPNSSRFENAEFDRLFEQLREMEDGFEKTELMAKMEAIVNKDLPWVMQYYSRNYILFHDYVKNFRYSDIIYNNIKYVKIQGK